MHTDPVEAGLTSGEGESPGQEQGQEHSQTPQGLTPHNQALQVQTPQGQTPLGRPKRQECGADAAADLPARRGEIPACCLLQTLRLGGARFAPAECVDHEVDRRPGGRDGHDQWLGDQLRD